MLLVNIITIAHTVSIRQFKIVGEYERNHILGNTIVSDSNEKNKLTQILRCKKESEIPSDYIYDINA